MALEKLKHPPLLAFCGFSGSGKTTLLSKLVQRLHAGGSNVGYLKHDAHGFSMDQAGKDTDRLRESGAQSVMIHHSEQTAVLHAGAPRWGEFEQVFADCHLLLVEGHKSLSLPKIVLLDQQDNMLNSLKAGEISAVEALVGFESSCPELPPSLSATPYFQRDDLNGILAFVREYFIRQLKRPIYGLVMAGGYSMRMGRDKALLDYHGVPQLQHLHQLMQPHCEKLFVSCRPEQWQRWQNQLPADLLQSMLPLYDRFLDFGPLSGLLTGMQAEREVDWLAIACDLPLLSEAVLETLISAHQQQKQDLKASLATAFSSHHDGLPEPLCTLYSPAMFPRLLQFLAQGYACPRKVLLNAPVHLLNLPAHSATALDNANHPEDFRHYRQQSVGSSSTHQPIQEN